MVGTTVQTPFFEGRLTVCQPEKGYRFNVDSLLLADFVLRQESGGTAFVELGAGSGVVSLLLGKGGMGPGHAIELQSELALCAAQTFVANEMGQLVCLEADIRTLGTHFESGCVPVVVTNPPYFQAGSGRLSDNPVEAAARHELTCTMNDVLSAMRFLLPPGGRGYLVYPVERFPDLMAELVRFKLSCEVLQWVHPNPERPAGHFLVRLVKSGKKGLQVLPPVITHQVGGEYGPWFAALSRRLFA